MSMSEVEIYAILVFMLQVMDGMSHSLLKTEKFITYASEEPIWVF